METALGLGSAVLLLVACVEVGWQAAAAAALDHAGGRVGRFISTGARTIPGTTIAPAGCRSGLIPDVAVKATGGFLKKDRLTYAATSYGSLTNAAAGQAGTAGVGSGGQTVTYTLTYKQPYLIPPTSAFLGAINPSGQRFRTHQTTFTAKNEPFTDAAC